MTEFPHHLRPNAEGLTGMRGEPISQADYDELSPTQLRGLRALNEVKIHDAFLADEASGFLADMYGDHKPDADGRCACGHTEVK